MLLVFFKGVCLYCMCMYICVYFIIKERLCICICMWFFKNYIMIVFNMDYMRVKGKIIKRNKKIIGYFVD